jgi:RNA polymerase sigma-70 factor (ECF subfamily)
MSSLDEQRALSFAVAYRMLGSVAEAEDVVQEALLRLHQADDVANADAYLTTVTTRLAIDVLRSARVKREAYVGSWLPEPLVEDDATGIVETDETVSLAFLVALERLTPDERAVLVLREAFDYGFGEIAEVVGKDPANCRQILSRARRRVADDRRRFDPDPGESRALALRFLEAAREGDMDGLVAMLASDAVLVGDGGGKARSIAAPMAGGEQVGRALATFYRMATEWGVELLPAVVNGGPGFRSFDAEGRLVNVVGLDVEGGVITRVHSMLNPDKLGHLGPVSDIALRPGQRPAGA